jgi:hypothetical protein
MHRLATVDSRFLRPVAMMIVAIIAQSWISPAEAGTCGVVDIDGVGWTAIEKIRLTPGIHSWIELDDRLLVCGTTASIDRMATRYVLVARHESVGENQLLLSRGSPTGDLEASGLRVITSSGGYAIVEAPIAENGPTPTVNRNRRNRSVFTPLPRNTIVLRQQANAPPQPKARTLPEFQPLVDQVNGNRWFDDVVTLASYNRNTHSPDNLNARDWLVTQFQNLGNLTITTPSFSVSGTTAYNVVARLDGVLDPDDWYVIGGHYDSTSENPSVAAPGAEDNASGCAGVLEMARIITTTQPRATVLFICYSGEEQGLYGSEAHVAALSASGDLDKIQAMLDMDMIGYTADADLDCLLETDPFAESLLDPFIDAAATYTQLRIVTTLSAWGSDHVPYLDAGVPALLTIENDWSQYPDYHSTNDLPANLTIAMAEEILRMNVGALANLIDAETGRLFSDGFESGNLVAWSTTNP